MQSSTKRRFTPEIIVATVILVMALPMALPVVRKVLGNNRGFLRDLGFLSGPSGTPLAWLLALIVTVAVIAFTVRNVPPVTRTWRQASWLKGLVVLAAIAAATVEEAVFRRLVMDGIQQTGGGNVMQIAASAVSFGAAHAIFGLIKRNLLIAVRASLVTGMMGGLLAVVYVVGERSLAPCITAHFLITVALEPGLLTAAVTGEWRYVPR
jgi:membrane protease YdiL (CAAX protease family)